MEVDPALIVEVVKTVHIGKEWGGFKLHEAVRKAFPELTTRTVFKMCRSGLIWTGEEKFPDPLSPLREGEIVSVTLKRAARYPDKLVTAANLRIETPCGPLLIVREDEDLLAVAKHPGCASHPALRRSGDTLVERVAFYLKAHESDDFKPALANRLDIETSGLVLIGKNFNSRRRLGFDIQRRRVEKRYLALVAGHPPDTGEIVLPLEKKPDSRDLAIYPPGHERLTPRVQEAHTRFKTILRSAKIALCALVEVELLTGRTHQIRRHMAMAGHPVALDKTYGDGGFNVALTEAAGLDRMFLHASRLRLPHPITRNIIEIEAPLPEELKEALRALGMEV